MTMSEHSPQSDLLPMELPSIALRAGSHAKTSAQQVGKLASLTEREAGCGLKSSAWLAIFDPPTSSWRTLQHCLVAQVSGQGHGLAEFSETWPRSGMMRNGTAYQLPTLAHITNATEFGSSLIPTPTACDFKGSGVPRADRGPKYNLRDWFKWHFNLQYPPVLVVEYMMGFPTGHTDLKPLETP
jgi:DNA (cytosine-5)-methyltransferase 1